MKAILTAIVLLWGHSFLLSQLSADDLFPELTGQQLIDKIRSEFEPDSTLSYRQARQKMFGEIDNHSGVVVLFYTGHKFSTPGLPANGNFANTEHIWPQSKFRKKKPMRSDLHHLFPTLSKVNSTRSNYPFADINDNETTKWFNSPNAQINKPDASNIDQFSEYKRNLFEPRESVKGDVARAMFYFCIIYGNRPIEKGFIKPQLDTLLKWHTADPATQNEIDRSEAIESIQGNENPFVLDPGLAERVIDQLR